MRPQHLARIANIRLLVGALGERCGWWQTRFTEESSQRFLELLFPRTFERAALESVSEVARRAHDERLSPRSYHLFRLPIALEEKLGHWLIDPDTPLSFPPATNDAVVAALGSIATGKGHAATGPVCLGKPVRLEHAGTLAEIAGTYVRAVHDGTYVVPYFEE